MEEDIITKSFILNIKVLKAIGLYNSHNSSTIKMRGFLFYFFFLVVVIALTTAKAFTETNTDALEMNFLFTFIADTSCYIFKLFPFLVNQQQIQKCIHYFGDSYYAPRDREEEKITEDCVRICRRNSKVYFFGIIISEILGPYSCLFQKEYKLPVDVWLPYDITAAPVAYYSTLTFLLPSVTYCGFTTLVDPLIAGLAYHATSQLKILKYRLRNLQTSAKNGNSESVITFESVSEELKLCVTRHDSVLQFIKFYEDCFTWVVFSQFAGSMFALCFCCIGLSMASDTFNTVSYVAFFYLLIFQIYFYCFYGTLLFEENDGLIVSVYMGAWYRYDVRVRKVLITLMERSKKPMIVTAGKFFDLTLQTFTSTVKKSYSLVAFLKKF